MNTEQALLNAIWAAPHDDLPRLVYADWLDEAGGRLNVARAELIRVQCALEQADDPVERRALRQRQDRLLKACRQTFTHGAPSAVRRAEFSRGFPYPQFVVTKRWPLPLAGGLAAAPLWRLHAHTSLASVLGELLKRHDELLRVGEIGLRKDAQIWLKAIVTCSYLRNVTTLELGGCSAGGDQLLLDVARSPHLSSLRSLSWEGMALSEAGIREFCFGPAAPRLRSLGLYSVGLTPRLLGIVSESPLRAGLRELAVREILFGDTVALYVVGKDWFLHRLSLDHSTLSDAGCERLAAWPGLANLEELNLHGNSITWQGYRTFAHSPYLACSPGCVVTVPAGAAADEVRTVASRLGPRANVMTSRGDRVRWD